MSIVFAERLKLLRTRKCVNQKELAELLNITQTQVSYYEKGKAVPPFHSLIALADYFSVSIDYLVGRVDDMPLFDQRLNRLFTDSLKNANYKLSIGQFASMCGASVDQVQAWMDGKSEPDSNTLKKIAATFNVTVDWLAGKTDVLYKGKTLRTKESLSIDDLNVLTGVDAYVLSQYEAGDVDNFNPDALARLCYYFDCTPNYLLGLSDFSRGQDSPSTFDSTLISEINELISSALESEMNTRKNYHRQINHLRSFLAFKLQQVREEKHLSHDDLLQKLGHGPFPLPITTKEIAAYEQGIKTMDIYTLTAFCAVFEVSPVHFIGLEGQVNV